MARQYFPWCPCCEQCTRRYNFTESPSFGWDLVDDPNGSTPVDMTWDSVNSQMTISGEGSVTAKVTPNPKVISVGTEILSLVSGSAGVTIRRVDSSDNISLWWMGGTSYELRHGSTVLESITGSGSDEIKLELSTPREATTDVLVYIGGALAHTETSVAFAMPDVLNLGIIVNGEANFEGMELSPCVGCEPILPDCNPFPAPLAYKLEVEGIAGEEYSVSINNWVYCPDPDALETLPYCDTFNGSYYLVPTVYTAVNEGPIGPCDQPQSGEWITPVGAVFPCEYSSVFRSGYVPGYGKPVPQGYLAGLMKDVCYTLHGTVGGVPQICSYPSDGAVWQIPPAPGNAQVRPAVRLWSHSIDLVNETIQFRMEFMDWQQTGSSPATYEGLYATYDSAVLPFSTDFLTTPITFNLVSSDGCSSMPSTLTLEPATDEEWDLIEWLSSCEPACEPPVTPQPGSCYLINLTLADENGGSWDYSLSLGLQYDEDSGSWYWEGGSLSAYPYVHDTCGPLPEFDIKIHCTEPEEGASKRWVLDFTTSGGSDRYPMTWFDAEETIPEFEGATDLMCSGQTWDLYAFNLRLETTEYQFGSCSWSACATPTSPIILAEISASCSGEAGSDGADGPLVFHASPSLPIGVDPDDVGGLSFWAPLPSSLNTGILKIAFLYVENGTAKIQITDGSGNPIPDMATTVSYSCDPSDGKPAFVDTSEKFYDWGFPGPYTTNQFGLCDGESSGFGGWRITFP